MRKVYVVGGDTSYVNWLLPLGYVCTDKLEDADLCFWTGGADVSPSLYGLNEHPTTSTSPRRDAEEVAIFKRAQELKLPHLSICRGAQFISVMHGALLIQHMSHPYHHLVETSDGRRIRMTSSHHQLPYPHNLPPDQYALLGWAIKDDGTYPLTPFAWGEDYTDNMMGDKEAEVIFYKAGAGSLCFQSHPEWAYPPREDADRAYISYCQEMVKKYLGV